MEYNREEARRCVELTEVHIKKKDLISALKFSTKAHKLFPTPETKCLMEKIASAVVDFKHQQKKRKSNESDLSDDGENSSCSSSNSSHSQNAEPQKKRLHESSKSSTSYSFKMFKGINKDESHKCLERAEECIQTKKFELAEKFVLKSKKLFPLTNADLLLERIKELKKPTYSEEQAKAVKKVRTSENFYKMLDIETTATVTEIKKAFKKLALLIHPDKNSAPDSGEVFVVASNAVETLCDRTKRLRYDRTLRTTARTTTPSNYSQRSSRAHTSWCSQYDGHPYHYYHTFDSDSNEYFSDNEDPNAFPPYAYDDFFYAFVGPSD